jgi:hypothetical protein
MYKRKYLMSLLLLVGLSQLNIEARRKKSGCNECSSKTKKQKKGGRKKNKKKEKKNKNN